MCMCVFGVFECDLVWMWVDLCEYVVFFDDLVFLE